VFSPSATIPPKPRPRQAKTSTTKTKTKASTSAPSSPTTTTSAADWGAPPSAAHRPSSGGANDGGSGANDGGSGGNSTTATALQPLRQLAQQLRLQPQQRAPLKIGAMRKGSPYGAGSLGIGPYVSGSGSGNGVGGVGGGRLPALVASVLSSPRRRVQGMVLAAALLVILLMLSSSSGGGGGGGAESGRAGERSSSSSSSSSSLAAAPSAGEGETYSVVIDAGSTGSRVHIFRFQGQGASLSLVSDTFEQLKPGLSAYPTDPKQAAASLKPLLDKAVATVPQALHRATAVTLKATAGLRLLPGGQADAILEAVRELLGSKGGYPFLLGGSSGTAAGDPELAVSIMDGAHEGAYAWLTLNYLLGRVGQGAAEVGTAEGPVAAIDLGGGSVQEAFALSKAEAAAAPEGYVTRLSAGGKDYDVYVHSYLGYGLMAARAKVIEVHGGGGGGGDSGSSGSSGSSSGTGSGSQADEDESHPCFARGTELTYSYAGKDYLVREVEEHGDFKRCAKAALKALEHDKDCGAPSRDACSFAGAWRGKPPHLAGAVPRVYYVSSYFWDRAVDAGIVEDAQAIEWETSPADFARRAAAACGKDAEGVRRAFRGRVGHEAAPYFCLDLSFCHTVLTQGFDLPESAPIRLVKQVMYKGQPIEAAWPLGAAIAALSAAA
jgi:apyrase